VNKDARTLRDQYGVSYQYALRCIRDKGLDGAIEFLAGLRAEARERVKSIAKEWP
jgi:hypothetical protein